MFNQVSCHKVINVFFKHSFIFNGFCISNSCCKYIFIPIIKIFKNAHFETPPEMCAFRLIRSPATFCWICALMELCMNITEHEPKNKLNVNTKTSSSHKLCIVSYVCKKRVPDNPVAPPDWLRSLHVCISRKKDVDFSTGQRKPWKDGE